MSRLDRVSAHGGSGIDARRHCVRSGSIGPSVGNKSIGTALVDKEAATPGTDVVVHIRGTAYGAKVVELPFYKRSYKIGAA